MQSVSTLRNDLQEPIEIAFSRFVGSVSTGDFAPCAVGTEYVTAPGNATHDTQCTAYVEQTLDACMQPGTDVQAKVFELYKYIVSVSRDFQLTHQTMTTIEAMRAF